MVSVVFCSAGPWTIATEIHFNLCYWSDGGRFKFTPKINTIAWIRCMPNFRTARMAFSVSSVNERRLPRVLSSLLHAADSCNCRRNERCWGAVCQGACVPWVRLTCCTNFIVWPDRLRPYPYPERLTLASTIASVFVLIHFCKQCIATGIETVQLNGFIFARFAPLALVYIGMVHIYDTCSWLQ